MKKIILSILLITPLFAFAQLSNIGIIDGIWFSDNQFFADDPIRIYTALQNNTGEDIQGVVEFFDNDISIGKKEFTILDRRIREVWIDTTISEGKHDYSVAITEASINKPGEALESVTPRIIKSKYTLRAKIDTDGDNIPDDTDTDDDNDGYSDKEEKEQGSDPVDSSSTPKNIPGNSPDSNDDWLDDLLSKIEKNNKNTDTEKPISVPLFIQELEESYPVVTHISEPLNQVQNTLVPKISKEQNRIINIQKEPEVTLGSRQVNSNSSQSHVQQKNPKKDWRYWLHSGYLLLLSGLKWIFSCIICMIILLFVILHLLLRFIFRIVRKRL